MKIPGSALRFISGVCLLATSACFIFAIIFLLTCNGTVAVALAILGFVLMKIGFKASSKLPRYEDFF